MKHRILGVSLLAVGLMAGMSLPRELTHPNAFANSPPPLMPSDLATASKSFREVAKAIGPAVVSIKVTKTSRQPKMRRTQGRSPFEDFPLPDLFRQFDPEFGFEMPDEGEMASGSGIIVDRRGYIVTNNHVVKDASKITVALSDEESDLPAKLVGTDPKTDLAVIQISTKENLATAEWGDSDSVEVGDWVVAIGNPFSLNHSVTEGIISAKRPNAGGIIGNGYQYDLLQTSAAINPGNSGGALATLDRKIIGVNTAIFTVNGGNLGIGFAIPANLAKSIVNQLIEKKKITRGWLGVEIQNVSQRMKRSLGIDGGALVKRVQPGSPAAESGLRVGDVIFEKDGTRLKDSSALSRAIASETPGKRIELRVVNQAKRNRNVTIKLGDLGSQELALQPNEEGGSESPGRFGMSIAPSKDGRYLSVYSVRPGSPADRAGIRPGDRIKEVNGQTVDTEREIEKLFAGAESLTLVVQRNGEDLFFEIGSSER